MNSTQTNLTSLLFQRFLYSHISDITIIFAADILIPRNHSINMYLYSQYFGDCFF